MRSRISIVLVSFFLLLLLIPVYAESVRTTGRVTEIVSPITPKEVRTSLTPTIESESQPAILPIVVKTPTRSLGDITVSKRSTDSVFEKEKESYDQIKEELLQSPASQQIQVRAKLTEQRQRVLMAMLNQVTVIYQRLDVTIDSLDAALLRLRTIHSKRAIPVAEFDVRYSRMQKDLYALHEESSHVAAELESAQTSISIARSVKDSSQSTKELLFHLKSFFSNYRILAQEVVSSS